MANIKTTHQEIIDNINTFEKHDGKTSLNWQDQQEYRRAQSALAYLLNVELPNRIIEENIRPVKHGDIDTNYMEWADKMNDDVLDKYYDAHELVQRIMVLQAIFNYKRKMSKSVKKVAQFA